MLKGSGEAGTQTQHPLAEIYLQLVRNDQLWTDSLDEALRTVIVAVNSALETQHIGLWSYGPDRQTLTLTLGYDSIRREFEHGAELLCARFADYFERLDCVQVEAIADAYHDSRFREFVSQGMLHPDLKATLSSTVRVANNSWGFFVASDLTKIREWTEWECWFVTSVATLVAQLITYAEAHRNELWLSFVADNLPVGVLKFDLDAQCDYANPYWRQLTGSHEGEAYGERWLEHVHPDDREMILDIVRMVGVSGESATAEMRLCVRERTHRLACSWVSERNVEGMPIAILGTFADVTYERALQESNARLHRINSIAARLYGLRDIDAVARESVEILSEHGASPLVTFFTYDAATNIATLIAQHDVRGIVTNLPKDAMRWQPQTAYQEDIDILNDMDALRMQPEMRAMALERGTNSIVYIWLRGEVHRIGLIVIEYREHIAMDAAQRDDLVAIGKAVSMALSNVLFISRVEYQATHDTLTGLPNREVLQNQLQKLDTSTGTTNGLMLLDLDRFKEVNDTLGHQVGDQLLMTLAQRLSDVLRETNALICRLGGDEFAILIRVTTPRKLQETAELLLELLRQPFLVDELILEIGGSIGVAMHPQHSNIGGELLRLVDVAMYRAKRNGTGWAWYDREFDLYTPERLALMQELRSAITNKQLVLYYQPRFNFHNGGIDGFEALIRWQHPQRGLLPPSEFLPLAEMNDVIHALTIEVLAQALTQQREWLRRGLRYSIAVNLSVRNLINEQCFIQLRQMLEQYGSDPTLLELEITETALMHDPLGASKLLTNLTGLGIKFSIDDFGTGYSSLAYLRQFPIHALKIDQAFVTDMVNTEQDAIIVKSTIALAHSLKLDVVAEGVEDEATLKLLRDMGCDQAQGYFISRPQPIAVIEQWLAQSAWPRL